MARYPSMTALLGLLAVAGYQNRDKIAELVSKLGTGPAQGGNAAQDAPGAPGQGDAGLAGVRGGGLGGMGPTGLGGLLSGGGGGFLNNGLREILERFTQNGHGEVAQSWINQGPNKAIEPEQLKSAIGQDILAELAQKTGLSSEEILARLSKELPA